MPLRHGAGQLLGYFEFDGTRDAGNKGPDTVDGLHHFDAHLGDWNAGDPTWGNAKGKRLIGVLNYLASTGVFFKMFYFGMAALLIKPPPPQCIEIPFPMQPP